MNRISRLIRRSLRMFPFLALLLLSCSRTPETPVPPETETVPRVESAEAGYYEAESLARYQAYSMELDLRIDEINAQNANEWIAEIGELIGSLTLRKGVYLYSDGSEYFYKKGELPRIYIENSYLIVHRTN